MKGPMLSETLLRLAVKRAADKIERNPDGSEWECRLSARRIANRTAKALGLTQYLLELAEEEMQRRSRKAVTP